MNIRGGKPTKSLTEEDVVKAAEDAIDRRLQKWKFGASSFLVGLGIFLVLGITWDQFRYFLFDKAYPPDEIYKRLKKELREDAVMRDGVAGDIVRLIGERVDSGYSKTFYYGPGVPARPDDGLLQFFAREDQKVELTVSAHGVGGFTLTANNRSVIKQIPTATKKTYDVDLAGQDISAYLYTKTSGDDDLPLIDAETELKERRKHIHTLKVTPLVLPKNEEATFELLILVRNEKLK
jgi:hypothetical protein